MTFQGAAGYLDTVGFLCKSFQLISELVSDTLSPAGSLPSVMKKDNHPSTELGFCFSSGILLFPRSLSGWKWPSLPGSLFSFFNTKNLLESLDLFDQKTKNLKIGPVRECGVFVGDKGAQGEARKAKGPGNYC